MAVNIRYGLSDTDPTQLKTLVVLNFNQQVRLNTYDKCMDTNVEIENIVVHYNGEIKDG